MLVLNVVYPLVPEEITRLLRAASARCWCSRKASRSSSSRRSLAIAAPRRTCRPPSHGKDVLPMAGEYTVEAIARGLAAFVGERRARGAAGRRRRVARRDRRRAATRWRRRSRSRCPPRPPQFCIGCPERPVFAALKLVQQDIGPRAHRRRHRLPRVRDVRAVLDRALDPRLRHEPREPRRRVADARAAHARGDGRRRLLAQRPAHRRAVGAVQRRRRGAGDPEERLHVGDRARRRSSPRRPTARRTRPRTSRRAACTRTR